MYKRRRDERLLECIVKSVIGVGEAEEGLRGLKDVGVAFVEASRIRERLSQHLWRNSLYGIDLREVTHGGMSVCQVARAALRIYRMDVV